MLLIGVATYFQGWRFDPILQVQNFYAARHLSELAMIMV